MLSEVQDTLHTASLHKHTVLVTEIDPAVTHPRLDPLRLKQALCNYLSNAIKFPVEHGRVTVRAFAQGPHLFRLKVEGTGIGIGIAPARRGADAGRAESQTDAVTAPDRGLVIEDDPHHQERLLAAVAQAGFEVDAAADSVEALRKAGETRCAALTLDLNLPSQRGLDLLASRRRHGARQATPVVGVAVPADEQSATLAIAHRLCKPIRSDEILLAMAPFRLLVPGRANVLVIDDDLHALDLMRAPLIGTGIGTGTGIGAVCVQDGRAALPNIDQPCPDAVILDLTLPEFGGFQVLDGLQRLAAWQQVPVCIWTSLLCPQVADRNRPVHKTCQQARSGRGGFGPSSGKGLPAMCCARGAGRYRRANTNRATAKPCTAAGSSSPPTHSQRTG